MSFRLFYYIVRGKWEWTKLWAKGVLPMARLRFSMWAFKWVMDEEYDIGIQLFGCLTLLKYKQSTLFLWNKKYPAAPKRLLLDEHPSLER